MARTNKYTAINFNDIYEKKITSSTTHKHRRSSSFSSPSPSAPTPNKTILSNSCIHGNMLVLSRPSPKPIVPQSQPQPSPPPSPAAATAHPPADSISLRPLGRTGSCPLTSQNPPVSPKTNNKFVPPHLRPGFVAREEKPGPELQKQTGLVSRSGFRPGSSGSQNLYGEDGRPKSGGGYERMRRGFEVEPVVMNRPRSVGSTRPD